MKLQVMLYTLSMLMILISVFLLIEYPNSNRYSLIAGFLMMIGLGTNLSAFLISNMKSVKV